MNKALKNVRKRWLDSLPPAQVQEQKHSMLLQYLQRYCTGIIVCENLIASKSETRGRATPATRHELLPEWSRRCPGRRACASLLHLHLRQSPSLPRPPATTPTTRPPSPPPGPTLFIRILFPLPGYSARLARHGLSTKTSEGFLSLWIQTETEKFWPLERGSDRSLGLILADNYLEFYTNPRRRTTSSGASIDQAPSFLYENHVQAIFQPFYIRYRKSFMALFFVVCFLACRCYSYPTGKLRRGDLRTNTNSLKFLPRYRSRGSSLLGHP